MGHRLVQNIRKKKKNGFFLRKTPHRYWPFWRPLVGRDTISPLAPHPKGPQQKKSCFVALFRCSWRSVWYGLNTWHSSRLRDRHSWLTKCGSFTVNQLVCSCNTGVSAFFFPSIRRRCNSFFLHTTPVSYTGYRTPVFQFFFLIDGTPYTTPVSCAWCDTVP